MGPTPTTTAADEIVSNDSNITPLSEEEIARLRAKGQLCYKPKRFKHPQFGMMMMTSDGKLYRVDEQGTISRGGKGRRVSKKKRRELNRAVRSVAAAQAASDEADEVLESLEA
jgi:poly-beta-hydroxyalkanoate depolymerase